MVAQIRQKGKKIMYEVLDKDLMIEACNIGDLTLDQVERFLRLWGDGSEIKSLTLFLKDDGTIVLNKDNPNYEHYKGLVCIYLKGDQETREELRNRLSDCFGKTLNTLESAIKLRATNKTMGMLKYNLVEPEGISYGVLKKIFDSYDSDVFGLYKILTLGYILGKRAERARRRKK